MPAAQQQVADSFLVSLRNATATQHAQLEETKLSKALLSDDVSVKAYTNYLEKMRTVIAFCEQTIFPLLKNVVPDINERSKLQLIQDDLEYIGINEQPYKTFQPFANSISAGFALGYMYVIEGSTLGGRVILKHLSHKLNIDEKNSGSFFAGYGVATGSKWKRFIESLAEYEKQCDCGNEIIEGAKHAFESIYKFFEQ